MNRRRHSGGGADVQLVEIDRAAGAGGNLLPVRTRVIGSNETQIASTGWMAACEQDLAVGRMRGEPHEILNRGYPRGHAVRAHQVEAVMSGKHQPRRIGRIDCQAVIVGQLFQFGQRYRLFAGSRHRDITGDDDDSRRREHCAR